MKLKFKKQAYQARAVEAVVDCFKGQLNNARTKYRIDSGIDKAKQATLFEDSGFKNSDLVLNDLQIFENIKESQRLQNLPQSSALVKTKVSPLNLDVEMETGTG